MSDLTTRELLAELAERMERTQNSINGCELGRQCREAIANLDAGVLDRRGEGQPTWAVVDVGVTCVECPDCGFTFSAEHVEPDGSYDCPACFVHRALNPRCHLCGQRKWASTPERAAYVSSFHMDRRHKGWTLEHVEADPPTAVRCKCGKHTFWLSVGDQAEGVLGAVGTWVSEGRLEILCCGSTVQLVSRTETETTDG